MTTAYLALGSNLGDRAAHLHAAIALLDATAGIDVRRVSSFIETASVGGPEDAPAFLNAVVHIETSLPPRQLLEACMAVEAAEGRVRTSRNAPRTLDVDVLLYGDATIDEPGLIVPHPRLHERAFVLVPLCELAPEHVHPTRGDTMRELRASLGSVSQPEPRNEAEG